MFTHLYRADEVDKSIAIDQYNRFMNFKEKLENEGIEIKNCHVSNSAAIMELPKYCS